jgi:hypothetical protein
MKTKLSFIAAAAAAWLATSGLALAQTMPAQDEAGKPMRGSASGAPAGEGPGAQGSQATPLQATDGYQTLPRPDVMIVVPAEPPQPAGTTTIIVPVQPAPRTQ